MSTTLRMKEIDGDINLAMGKEMVPGSEIATVMGDRLVVSYLVPDTDCESPLDSCDGEGNIYTARRHAPRGDHEAMQKALGLDGDWQPKPLKVNAADIAEHVKALLKTDETLSSALIWILHRFSMKRTYLQAIDIAVDEIVENESDIEASIKQAFTGGAVAEGAEDAGNIERLSGLFTTAIAAVGVSVADPYAVRLDVYEHDGIAYSVSGEGMQCRFDTARGGAVWVADACARYNINHNLANALGIKIDDIETFDRTAVTEARNKAVDEYCRSVLNGYNAWLSGECYCIVTETLVKDENSGDWDSEYYECCGGYIGYQCAVDECQSDHKSHIRNLEKKAA